LVELPADDITRFIGRYSIGRDSNPLDTMGSLHFLRIKVPGGFITSGQLRGIAEIAEIYGKGQGEITDRQDIQLHWINADDSLDIFSRMEELGFATDMCGQGFSGPEYGDVRNIVCCPASGVDETELLDGRSLLKKLSEYFIGNNSFHNMPRKFKASITGCGSDCTRAVINDLALAAVEKEGEAGYALLTGGSVGPSLPGPRLAKPLGIFIHPEDAFDLMVAVVEIHRDHGSRENKAKARFKWLFDAWGKEKFTKALEAKMGRSLDQYDGPVFDREDSHFGVQPQRQGGLFYVNVPTLGGRVQSREMRLFADLSDMFGNGDIRLTPRQNIILANISDKDALLGRLTEAGVTLKGSYLRYSSVGCASDFCGKTVTPHCKETLWQSVNHLEDRFEEGLLNEARLTLHVCGCPNNCCAKEIATVGLSGALTKAGDGTKQVYDIFLGGEFGIKTSTGRGVELRVPAEIIPDKIEHLLTSYAAMRKPSENLAHFCNRLSIEELKSCLTTAKET
jgi:sulfite reductase (ferredoxin)